MSKPAPQSGASLVSVMVGLVISLVATVALMATFRVAAQVAAQARETGSNDSQLISGLLGSAIIVQDAGYGVEVPAYGVNLQSLSSASLSNGRITGTKVDPGVAANALIWTSAIENATQCAGILAPTSGGLIYLGPVSCSTTADWSALSWSSKNLASTSNLTSSSGVTLKAEASNCTPYGLTGTQANYRLSLTATNSSGVALSATHCLQNFQ